MVEQITLYTSRVCPYAHRVEIALAEARAPYSAYELDLQHKPDWYAPLVNPAGKVPAIAYGGPPSPPSAPSPHSTKLAESLVLVEFVADLFPAARLLPASPVARARARLFIDAVTARFVPAWHAFLHGKASADEFCRAVEHIEALLPPSEGADVHGPFAVGAYSIADVAITPFVARIRVALLHELGAYPLGEGKRVWETMTGAGAGGRFARFGRYCADLLERESFKATFDEAYITETQKTRHASLRQRN
ncbi:glutathione S-transferase C-terminal-like protein [Daedaleopsis nitida]|nr:glutathione S-transferase C-terminal-like protein [Daedaleopsis nitida]